MRPLSARRTTDCINFAEVNTDSLMALTAADSAQKVEVSRLPLLATYLLILVALIDSQVVAAITPQIAAGLSAAKTVVASSVTAYAVAAAAVALLLGRYSRRIHPNTWLPLSAGIFVAASLVAAFSPHVVIFFAARSLAGLAGGLISALAIAALANASTYAKRGKQMSGVAISYFLAPVLGVPLGTFLTGFYGWRTVFVLSAVLVLLAGLLVRRFPLPAAAPAVAADINGHANAEQHTTQKSPTASHSIWKLATHSRSTQMGIISAFFVSGGLVGFTTYLGTWLSDAFNAGTREVGVVYALAGTGAVAGGALGGFLADRFGKRRIAVQSSLGLMALLLLLPTFTQSLTLLALICATAFFAALRVAPLQALITELVGQGERATYVALRNGASQIGIAIAVAASGFLYAKYGLMSVGALCAALTAGAWLSIRVMDDPHDAMLANERADHRRKNRWMRRVATFAVALILFICLGLPLLLSFAITKAGTRPDERARTDTPAAQGASFESVTFTSSDGNHLAGWYLPSRQHRTTIIMTHGLFRSRYELLDRGIALWRLGYGVLLYDLRRHGQSRAEFSTMGYKERHDVLAAVDFVRRRDPGHKIVLMGVSMGAAATLLAASETQGIEAIIAESSFLSLSNTIYHHVGLAHLPAFPFAPLLVKFTAWRMNYDPADFDVLQAVRKISCPILFIGGSDDVRMPNDTVLEPLYAAASHPRKSKFIVEGATHGHAYDIAPEAYIKAISDFLQAVESNRFPTS